MNKSLENAKNCSLPMAHGIALITVNSIVCILGSFGNLLLCFAIATHPLLRRTSNYLLFSLAIADLFVTLVCEPVLLEIFYNRTFFHECKASLERPYRLIVNLSCSASAIHLASISVDRFIAVAFPLHHKIFMKKCGLVILLTASWALPISIPLLMVVLPPSFPKEFVAMTSFSLSCFVIIFSYFMIVVFLLRYKKKRKDLRATTLSVKFTSRREVRVAYTLAIATGVFTVCWVPVKTMRFVIGMKPNSPLHMWLRTLALSNSAMNFLIYSARMRAFKEAYLSIFQKMCRL